LIRVFVAVAVLVASVHASSPPPCPPNTSVVAQEGRFGTFFTDQMKRCQQLCASANCVGTPKLLGPLVRCLNITASTSADFSELKHETASLCVVVGSDVVLKNPLKLGSGDDCVQILTNATVGDILTGRGDDYVTLGTGVTAHNINLGAGEDVLNVGASNVINAIDGGAGRDLILGSGVSSATPFIVGNIRLGDGGDGLNFDYARVNNIDGNGGSDIVILTNSTIEKTLDVGGASDYVSLTATNITKLEGGKGDNIFALHGTLNMVGEVADDDDDDSSLVCSR